MARYQAGESRCRLCCLLEDPDDMATQPALAPGSVSHPDAPFHTTSTDGHDDGTDSDDEDAAAAPSATADGGHAATEGEHAAASWPPTPPLATPDTDPHQHAQSTTDAGSTAVSPPLHAQSDPTHAGAAHQPPATIPPLPPRPTPPPAAPPTPTRPPTPNRTPTPTPQ